MHAAHMIKTENEFDYYELIDFLYILAYTCMHNRQYIGFRGVIIKLFTGL